MARKNLSIKEFEDEDNDYDDDVYDIELNRSLYNRKHARQRHSFRRRIEDLFEEKQLRENEYF